LCLYYSVRQRFDPPAVRLLWAISHLSMVVVVVGVLFLTKQHQQQQQQPHGRTMLQFSDASAVIHVGLSVTGMLHYDCVHVSAINKTNDTCPIQ